MMDTHTPRIVGTFVDDEVDTAAPDSVQEGRAPRAARPPLRVQRVFTDSDSSYESVVHPAVQTNPRRGNIRQLPLRQSERHSVPPAPAAPTAAAQVPLPGHAPDPADSSAPLSTLELTRRIQQLSKDLLLGTVIVTVNIAELAAHVISLVGLVVLIFPGQFLHTSLIALYRRATALESDYGEAFAHAWQCYRNIAQARWQLGPFELSLSFVVGFALLAPFVALKCLELASALVHVAK